MRNSGIAFSILCALLFSFISPIEAAEFTELCRTGTPQQIQQALQGGAKANARDSEGELPLIAALNNKAALEVLPMLVRAGARVNGKNAAGLTALHVAAHRYPPETTVELLRLKADVNADAGDMGSPLMAALLREPIDLQLVNLLIHTGGNVNFTDRGGLTPLIQAIAVKASPEVIGLLLKNGAEVDRTSPKIDNETPLMVAAGYSPPAVVKLLLDAGASIAAKNASGKTAKDYAAEANMTQNLNLIASEEKARTAGTLPERTEPAGATPKRATPKGATLPPPIVVDLPVLADPDEGAELGIAPVVPDAGTSAKSSPQPQSPPATPVPETKPAPQVTPPTPAPRSTVSTPQAGTRQNRSILDASSIASVVDMLSGNIYYVFLFLSCCFGCWLASIIVLRASLKPVEIALCGIVMAILTFMLSWFWRKFFGEEFFTSLIVLLLYCAAASAVNGLAFMPVMRRPLTGERLSFGDAALTAFVAFSYCVSMHGMLTLSSILVMMHQYFMVFVLIVFMVSPYLCYWLSSRVVLKESPIMPELLTGVFAMGLVTWGTGLFLRGGFQLFPRLFLRLLSPLADVFVSIARMPSFLAWIFGMGVLALMMMVIAVPIIKRTITNPPDDSPLSGGSAFRIGLLGAVFHVLVLRVLLFLVMNSMRYALAPLMRGGF